MSDLMVASRAVRKHFGSLEVLKGIDLDVANGEVMCLVGPSGSGKSTFLRCINHLERIDGGTLRVDGHLVGYREKGGKLYELREKEIAERRQGIGMVFQRFNLFPHMTAQENVMEAPIQVLGQPRRRRPPRRRSTAGPGRARGQVRRLPGHALRWPAAAGGDRPGAGDEATADAVRRAHLRARPRTGRRGARRDARARRRRA